MRIIDTRQLVRQAWIEIYQATGEAPNDAAVKEWFVKKEGGSRNNNVVSKELQAIRREAEQGYFDNLTMPGLKLEFPRDLAAVASQFFSELVKGARAHAGQELSVERERLASEARAVRSDAEARVAQAQTEAQTATARAQTLEALLRDRDDALRRQEAELASLQEQVAQMNELRGMLAQANEQLQTSRADLAEKSARLGQVEAECASLRQRQRRAKAVAKPDAQRT